MLIVVPDIVSPGAGLVNLTSAHASVKSVASRESVRRTMFGSE